MLTLSVAPPPLTVGGDGVVRVSGSRVTLESVVVAFKEGATPEEVAQQYPSLRLADVYATISYYLQHQPEVDDYLFERRHEARMAREDNEARWVPDGIRQRLLARQKSRGVGVEARPEADNRSAGGAT